MSNLIKAGTSLLTLGDSIMNVGPYSVGSGEALADDPVDYTALLNMGMTEAHSILNTTAYRDESDNVRPTHWADRDGDWSNPSTWSQNQVPGDNANVVIEENVSVVMDMDPTARIGWMRVDGSLITDTTKDTTLRVETMVIGPTGLYQAGTQAEPIPPEVQAEVEILDNGDIDVFFDPILMSRGIINLGTRRIFGAVKTPFLRNAVDPQAGDTSVTLESVPSGWRVNDEIVIIGTRWIPLSDQGTNPGDPRVMSYEDETRTIASIVGNVVNFVGGLTFNHNGDWKNSANKGHVANITRNYTTYSENTSDVHRRGHQLSMMNGVHDVNYASAKDLGRTDKSVVSDDAGNFSPITATSNVRGRYNDHIHRVKGTQARHIGCVLQGSPGWGISHHDADAVMNDNIAYDCFGAGMVAETANEAGEWKRNLSFHLEGVTGGFKEAAFYNVYDHGRVGECFYYQGRGLTMQDNIGASSPGGGGHIFNVRDGGGIYAQNIPNTTSDLVYPQAAMHRETMVNEWVPIKNAENWETYGCAAGVFIIKASPTQNHLVRSNINGIKSWECPLGAHFQYTGHYTIKDFYASGAQATFYQSNQKGIETSVNTVDFVVRGADIRGFAQGIYMQKEAVNLTATEDMPGYPTTHSWDYYFLDVVFTDCDANYVNAPNAVLGADTDVIDNEANFTPVTTTFAPDVAIARCILNPAESVDLHGVITDTLGSKNTDTEYFDNIMIQGYGGQNVIDADGYYQDPSQGDENVLLITYPFQGRLDDEPSFIVSPVKITAADGWTAFWLSSKTNNGPIP